MLCNRELDARDVLRSMAAGHQTVAMNKVPAMEEEKTDDDLPFTKDLFTFGFSGSVFSIERFGAPH